MARYVQYDLTLDAIQRQIDEIYHANLRTSEELRESLERLRSRYDIRNSYFGVPRRIQPLEEQPYERARKLLREILTEKQRQQFDKHGVFAVRGSAGGEYVVDNRLQTVWRVKRERGGAIVERRCLVMADAVIPAPDATIARKLLIEANETEFISRSNRFPRIRDQRTLDHRANRDTLMALVGELPQPPRKRRAARIASYVRWWPRRVKSWLIYGW